MKIVISNEPLEGYFNINLPNPVLHSFPQTEHDRICFVINSDSQHEEMVLVTEVLEELYRRDLRNYKIVLNGVYISDQSGAVLNALGWENTVLFQNYEKDNPMREKEKLRSNAFQRLKALINEKRLQDED